MEQTEHRRGIDHLADVGPARPGNNRRANARRAASRRRALLGLAVLLPLAGLPAGCSLSFPVNGVAADATATGSIDRAAAALTSGLDAEDLRRARAALAVALDPQGNGARAGWQNPQTGAHGAFAASAPPFPERDRVCRAFAGDITPGTGATRRVSGSACRDSDGSWTMREHAKVAT